MPLASQCPSGCSLLQGASMGEVPCALGTGSKCLGRDGTAGEPSFSLLQTSLMILGQDGGTGSCHKDEPVGGPITESCPPPALPHSTKAEPDPAPGNLMLPRVTDKERRESAIRGHGFQLVP